MVFSLVLTLIGLGCIIFGSNYLIDGAAGFARRFKISEFIIGMTIVGFGTSCPELVVSTIGAIQRNSDVCIGNIIGSNIFNTAFILGLSCLFFNSIPITERNKKIDIPFTFLVTVLLPVVGLTNLVLSRFEAIVFLCLFACYLFVTLKNDKQDFEEESSHDILPLKKSFIYTIGGLTSLILGGSAFVYGAEHIAKFIGVSDKFIAITVLAGGTSLPELATCLMAAYKGRNQMALGDILGSNIFNILFVLGVGGCIYPLSFANINLFDVGALIASMLIIVLSSFVDEPKISRVSGVVLFILYFVYFSYLCVKF